MRAGGCTLQQALTAEAATVIKQAVTLAKRRGHVQVTPLHVANTMLSSSQGLLRTACLQSHSHPLQCKALELCFNVALNRLPASSSANSSVVPMMGSQCSQQQHHPSISNALVAAFKRAQAHQRRGSVENQQQPLLAVKIELDQLIISILDDPSVSRVMREAGFSSTQVKSNVEKAGSLERTRTNSSSKSSYKTSDQTMGVHHKPREASDYCTRNEDDVSKVIETLMEKKRRNPIIVGECVATLEDVIRHVMEKVEKGDAPEAVKDVKFISLSLQSLMGKTKVEVDYEIQELRSCFVKNDNMGRLSKGGVILYMGDLKWTADFRVDCFSDKEATRLGLYCPVEHMIMELGKLLVCDDDDGRFWVMGVASFQTYIKCRDGHPSLESIWSLLPLTIAADTLSLSLNSDREARSAQSGSNCDNNQSSSTTLPTWLRQYKDENKRPDINHQECVHVESLCKWNSISYSVQEQYTSSCGKTMPPISSVSPSSSTSGFSSEYQNPNFFHQNWPSLLQHESTTHSNTTSSEGVNKAFETSLAMQQHTQSPFSSNPNSTTSSSDVVMETEITEYVSKFKSITAENFELLRGALEKKVPSQMDIIPDIAGTILRCRSGMMKRNGEFNLNNSIDFPKEETWLLFQGSNVPAKVKIGRELAWLVFGSRSNFISVALSSFSTDEYLIRNKTTPADKSCSSYIDRFSKEVSSNPHRVFFIDDIEQADYWTQIGLKQSIERGKVTDSEGQEVSLCDSIIILSCESMSSRSRACSPPVRKKSHGADDEADKDDTPDQVTSPCVSLDLDLNLSVEDNASSNDMGILILESVDRRFIFKIQESS